MFQKVERRGFDTHLLYKNAINGDHYGTGLRGILLTLKHILQNEGWSGLYDGLETDTAATLLSKYFRLVF